MGLMFVLGFFGGGIGGACVSYVRCFLFSGQTTVILRTGLFQYEACLL